MIQPASELCWYWELAPADLLMGYRFIKAWPVQKMRQEVTPFSSPKKLLEGASFSYQLAVSSRSVDPWIQDLHADMAPLGMPISGDRRSGILIFDADRIIGSFIIEGNLVGNGYKMVVDQDRRQHGLAMRMLVEWCWQTRRHRIRLEQGGITLVSVKALLSAHREVVERATKAGLPVPKRVAEAIAQGQQAAQIIAEATKVERFDGWQLAKPGEENTP